MKNFARLVRYALPYKVRFGLSICCAAMVALLFFAELGAVYPLLHILFDDQNPQKWIAKKIEAIEDEVQVLEARKVEADRVQDVARSGRRDFEDLRERGRVLRADLLEEEKALRTHEDRLGDVEAVDSSTTEQVARLEALRREHRMAEARSKELADCSSMLRKDDKVSLNRRVVDIEDEIKSQGKWLRGYTLVQPYINRYLPKDSFKSLVLLIGMVMLGVAFKGVFLFLQETLVADVMQLTLFRIRNAFFRSTVNLDLASFSDQGSSELMARFTNDMDSFGQGLNTLMSKLIREPMRIASCLCGRSFSTGG